MTKAKYAESIVKFIKDDKKLTESVVQASTVNNNANVDELTMDLASMLASHAHHLQEQQDAAAAGNGNGSEGSGKISEETHGIIEHFLTKYGVNKKGASTIAENILKLLKKPQDIPGPANDAGGNSSSGGGSKKFKVVAYCIRVLLTIVEKKVDVFTALKMEASKKK